MLYSRTIFILNIRVCIYQHQMLSPPLPCPPPLAATILFSMPVGCFCFVDRFTCVIVYIPHTSVVIYLSFSFWFTSLSMIISSCIYVASNGITSFFLIAEYYYFVYIYIYYIFFMHPWVEIWVASISWLLWTVLLWTLVCIFLKFML